MADTEKFDERLSTSADGSDHTLPYTKEFAPISNGASKANSRPNSQTRRTLSRTRSNNGYGCDDNRESVEDLEVVGQAVSVKDPFDVKWENGDNDPMNPRSMAHGKKWLVVLIVSASSLCV